MIDSLSKMIFLSCPERSQLTMSQQTNSEFRSSSVPTFSLLRFCVQFCSLIAFIPICVYGNAYASDINPIRSSDSFPQPSARRAAGKISHPLLISKQIAFLVTCSSSFLFVLPIALCLSSTITKVNLMLSPSFSYRFSQLLISSFQETHFQNIKASLRMSEYFSLLRNQFSIIFKHVEN